MEEVKNFIWDEKLIEKLKSDEKVVLSIIGVKGSGMSYSGIYLTQKIAEIMDLPTNFKIATISDLNLEFFR